MVVANDDWRSATMAASSDRIIDSKMDKASIIKDAIDYIQELHEQERRIQADLMQLESGKLKKNAVFDLDQEIPTLSRLKKKKIDHSYDSRRSTTSSIEDLEYAAAREWTKWELMTAHLLPNEDNIKKGDDDKFSLVLSGEMKTVTYLDTEQKLVLPEIGYQLLHNYADQIQNWGWLCNIRSLGSRSFKKNLNLLHRQSTVVTLNAVPCIVGVNLTDVDLLEFLQQLADTDGSSTIPPSVHRVLNSKACRGAIMFGDTLLPSECSLIVEELKQTSLCFQCAHGRPTTVPLVNLEALHKQIAKLGLWNGGSNELWHGLHQHEPSLERAAQRLSSARGLS